MATDKTIEASINVRLLIDDQDLPQAEEIEQRKRTLQRDSFCYFTEEINRENGLVLDKTSENWPASIAAMGMALAAWPVGASRSYISRAEAATLTLTMLRFLAESEQSDKPDATGYKGFYYHFLDMKTGRRVWECELSSIDTALLIAGAMVARAFFDGDTPAEKEIRSLVTMIYERVDWRWMVDRDQTFCHGWTPESGFLPYHWQGYDEALILYILGLGSPTHPIEPRHYAAWCGSYRWTEVYGYEYLYAGPLFIHQMSHIWCDFRGIRDAPMRERDCDYFENSRRATYVHWEYARRNPLGYPHYGPLRWGISASDGPGQSGRHARRVDGIDRIFFDYIARGAPFGPDDGTLAPWAVVASLPFAPEIVIPAIHDLGRLDVRTQNPYGFKASFNPAFRPADDDDGVGWTSPYHFGVNEGPTVLMIENFRTEQIWTLMRTCGCLIHGLRQAGFSGGWLDHCD